MLVHSLNRLIVLLGLLFIYSAHAEPELTCQVRCSDTKLRTGIADLVSSGLATSKLEQPILDVTIFHDGFKRGIFHSFGVITEGATPKAVLSSTESKGDVRVQRAYDLNLRVYKTDKARINSSARAGIKKIEVENLEPGLLYRFRLHDGGSAGQEVACEAPVCPADMIEGSKP